MSTAMLAGRFEAKGSGNFWANHRESALNWLALGLLLAAWNGVDDTPSKSAPRPAALKGYDTVSVRALQRTSP